MRVWIRVINTPVTNHGIHNHPLRKTIDRNRHPLAGSFPSKYTNNYMPKPRRTESSIRLRSRSSIVLLAYHKLLTGWPSVL